MSNFHFVPIPTEEHYLLAWKPHWWPHVEHYARRNKENVGDMLKQIASGLVQLGLAWDDENKRAVGMIGIQYRQQGDELIAELVWAAGSSMKKWRRLLPEVHKFLKEHQHVDIVRPICRKGWSRYLAPHGYSTRFYIMEHRL